MAGNLITENTHTNKGGIYEKDIYTYDGSGNKIEEGSCKPYVDRYSKEIKCDYRPIYGWNYNDKNQMTKSFQLADFSPHNTDAYFKYDKHGQEIEAKGYYINKKDTVLGYHYITEYNERGNKTKEIELVGRYRSIGFDKYKEERIEYDKFQNIILN